MSFSESSQKETDLPANAPMNKSLLSFAGLSLISLFILLPVFQFLDSNPFFHFRFGMDQTLLALIVFCFGFAPIFCFLAFVKFIIGQSRIELYTRIILGASLLLFISHLYSTTLQELTPVLKGCILLTIFAIGSAAILKTSREVVWGLAWLSILIVPVAGYHGYKQYLTIPELIRNAEAQPAVALMDLNNIYIFFLDGSEITSAYLGEDYFPSEEFLPNFRKFLMEDAQWFPKALANAPVTYLSFPSMITGKLYVSGFNNYLRNEKNIFSILKSRYSIHTFLHTKTSFCMEQPESCSPYNAPVYAEPLDILFQMYGFISTFRLYPISFKIGELNKDSYHRAIFEKGFLKRVETDPDKGNLYIIQLFDREKSQMKDFDKLIGDFLSILKKTDKYEDAVIVIMSDHGFISGPYPNYGTKAEQTWPLYKVPFAIKTPGTGKGKIYEYKAQSIDIAPTLLGQILSAEELGRLRFDGVDVLRNRPQREHYFNLSKKGVVYQFGDSKGGKPELIEVPLSQVRLATHEK